MIFDETALEHHGVKGQKWGVRRKAKKIAKADKKFEQNAKSFGTFAKIYNQAAGKANADLPGINAKYAGKDLSKPGKLQDKYHAEVIGNLNKHLNAVAGSMTNASGTKKLNAVMSPDFSGILISSVDIAHAQDDTMRFKLTRNAMGLITKMEWDDSMTQSDEVGEFLEHFGVKGMKWGTRKSAHSPSSEGHAARQSLKKPAHALTNNELKVANERLNLEANFNRLNSSKVANGRKVATEILATVGIGVSVFNLVKSPAGQASIAAGKKLLSR